MDKYETIEEASQAAMSLGITSQPDYKKCYKEDPKLPAHPDQVYSDDWASFGTWYGFLGSEKKVNREAIILEFDGWGVLYDSFIATAQRSILHKKRTCLGFIYKFIMENNYPDRPEEFLLKNTKVNSKQYEAFFDYFGDKDKAKFHTVVLEFLDYCLSELCILDDDDDVKSIHPDYHNPLKQFSSDLLEIKQEKLTESNKPSLAYTYVVAAKEWVVPTIAKSFGDLTHLYNLVETDWFDVAPSLIDEDDPDCVYRYVEKDRRKGKHTGDLIGAHNEKVYQMWSPVRFLSLFTLLSVPARGQQILWCDSGEADEYIPQFLHGKVEWSNNTGSMAGRTDKQGFIKEYEDNEIGLHLTTNKTSKMEGGYNIPWTPEGFAYWMIKLRNWQSKYNQISEPTKWTDIHLRTPIGSSILKHRGSNCFLFRQPNSCNPYLPSILKNTLAYALHQIEQSDNPLTTLLSDKGNVGSYRSDYTPHSMRVSLITAFVVDAKVPIHIVQKLVGHARIVMTIYYTKIGLAEMRDELSEGQKRALAAGTKREEQDIRNKQFEDVKNSLIANDPLLLSRLNNQHPPSAYSFTDIGMCPMGGGRCEEGGEVYNEGSSEKYKKYLPVAAGHLGEKNCIRCRFFITGPGYTGGLMAVANEIGLKQIYIKQKEKKLLIHIESLEDERYDSEQSDTLFTKSLELQKAEANLEIVAKETSMYGTDAVHIVRLVNQCSALLNESIKKDTTTENVLIANTEPMEINWSIDETNSEFHQLSTVCENATIYALSDASNAMARRTQLIDGMAYQNGLESRVYMLSPEQQLAVGNQMSALLKSRFKSWDNVEKLMRAELYLDDLNDDEQLTPVRDEVKKILLSNELKLGFRSPYMEEL